MMGLNERIWKWVQSLTEWEEWIERGNTPGAERIKERRKLARFQREARRRK